MANNLQFSPGTRALAEFMGVSLPEAPQFDQSTESSSPSLLQVMSSPVLSPPSPSLVGRTALLPVVAEDDDLTHLLDGLDLTNAEFVPLDLDTDLLFDVRARPQASPRLPRPAQRASASAAASSASELFGRMFPAPRISRPAYVSRTTPTRNPLSAASFEFDRRGMPQSALTSHLNQMLFGVEDPSLLPILGPIPKNLPKAVRQPELSFVPKPGDILEAGFLEEQDDYYTHLICTSPSTSALDRFAIVTGDDIYVRNNKTGAIFKVAMDAGRKEFSYSSRKMIPTAVAFSPSGKGLLVGTQDGKVEHWRVSENGTCEFLCYIPIKGDRNKVNAVAFANGRLIAGTNGGMLYEFDPETGETIEARSLGNLSICSIAVSPDGKTVAAAVEHKVLGEGQETRLYLLKPNGNGEPGRTNFEQMKRIFKIPKHTFKMTFSPDGKKLALVTGTYSGRLIFLEIGSGAGKEALVSYPHKVKENIDDKGRYILKFYGRDEDGAAYGWQATGVHWIKSEKNDLLMATLSSGETVFIPLDREHLAMGQPLTQRTHLSSNEPHDVHQARITYSAYRGGTLYTVAPREPVPGNPAETGVVRTTKVEREAQPRKARSGFDLSSFSIR